MPIESAFDRRGNHENQRSHSREAPRTWHDARAGGNAPGVSTPAVNTWERGAGYLDITLIPALARLVARVEAWSAGRA